MNYKEWTNPDKLLSWGFEKEEEHSTDSVRWVCYKKRIDIGTSDMYFEIVITYELTIHDSPTATYSENHYYFYEKTECILKDATEQTIFITRFDFETKKDLISLAKMYV